HLRCHRFLLRRIRLDKSSNLLQHVGRNESRILFSETVRRNVGTRSRASQLPKGAGIVVADNGDICARAHIGVDLYPLDDSSSEPPKDVGVRSEEHTSELQS